MVVEEFMFLMNSYKEEFVYSNWEDEYQFIEASLSKIPIFFLRIIKNTLERETCGVSFGGDTIK
jgi:hypothetical protein